MIDLNHTREQMLVEVNASEKVFAHCLHDPTAPEFAALEEARLVVRGKTPDELLPVLSAAFSRRFPQVPHEQLFADLLYLLKKGLGNAYKWGNKKNPDKWITVETVATRTGAVVAISDDGEGFDTQAIFAQLERDEHYFTHGGSGFIHFNKTKSLISYAHDGRTLLIRFLCVGELGKAVAVAESFALGVAGNEEFMKTLLAVELPYFRKKKVTLDSCHIYVPEKKEEDNQPEIKYVLDYHKGKSEKVNHVTLIGRLLPELAAQTDFTVARQLYRGPFKGKKDVRIPKPVTVSTQPSLVLYKFNPVMNFREYLKKVVEVPKFVKVVTMVALALLTFHQSALVLDNVEDWDDDFEQHRRAQKRVATKLAYVSPQRAERFNQFFQQLEQRATALKHYERIPIHGAFGWDCVLSDDQHFYLYQFNHCRRSHPGFDLGNFLADMLQFYVLRAKGDQDFYSAGRQAFLENYFGNSPPAWREDLPFFIASGMLLRLDRLLERPEKKWIPKVDAFLEQCEQSMRET